MMSAIKSGTVAYSRFARVAELEEAKQDEIKARNKISVDRSGGGL
jgi:glycerol-3-phosphate dehydrogenase